ncbi:hypothetical protein [Shewanella surugensis]|uniref:Uncharacterized protein n=1 Tax=Shewanella surugensis TaxID=212020 RepID=A0ABT0L695_9GAMM|nr:hypothetical protein [Shewanella surugensis]MCL1123209.1 hypothetical protein [Shewanella surugensis]
MTIRDHEALCADCQKPIPGSECKEHDWHHDHFDDHTDHLEDVMHRHYTHLEHYQMLQVQADQAQTEDEWSQLNIIHHYLKKHIRLLLENVQEALCEHGFHSGITEETVTLTRDDISTSFVVGVTLHIADVPVREGEVASKNIHSHNIIRFYSVAQGKNIECQFSNRKMQSRIFPLHSHHRESHHQDSHHHEDSHTQQEIHEIITDFIRYILLSRRAEMVMIN